MARLSELFANDKTSEADCSSNLATSIQELENLKKRRQKWPPVNSGEEKYRKGLKGVMDEEMGWEG